MEKSIVENEINFKDFVLHRGFPAILISENGQYRGRREQITGLNSHTYSQKANVQKIVPVIENVLKADTAKKWRCFLASVLRTLNSIVGALSPKEIEGMYSDDSIKCIYY
jgi:hypothetical protein